MTFPPTEFMAPAGRPESANARAMLSVSVLNTMERKTATPSVPPIWRKNVADAVETPMSRRGPAFCTAMMSVCMQLPRPNPMIAMTTIGFHTGVSHSICANSNIPMVMSAVPTSGKIL